jgi:hypothetical protein
MNNPINNSPRISIQLDKKATTKIHNEFKTLLNSDKSFYDKCKIIASDYLGSRKIDHNKVLFGFWVPGLKDGLLKHQAEQIKLELYTLIKRDYFNTLLKEKEAICLFQKELIQLQPIDDYMIGVLNNVQIGNKEQLGTLYWLKYNTDNRSYVLRDPLVQSAPFGIYAPAETFDMEEMLKNRRDMEYFRKHFKLKRTDGTLRAYDIGSTLEIHTETATKEGTLQALTQKYKHIAQKIQTEIEKKSKNIYHTLSPDELNYTGFDTIELTPEVPTVERESIHNLYGEFFNILEEKDNIVTVELKKPDISNWGYDTPIIGTASISPSLLESLRPHEFLEFVETLHMMPDKPIQLSLDAVLGHADFQGALLMQTFEDISPDPSNIKYIHSKYFRGPNMYGRDINYADPQVRAILLEMLQRKINMGFDCMRVDGGQDFVQEIDEQTGFRKQDDQFINEMVNIIQDINGIKRQLDTNIEDGRPWPNDMNWLYNAIYIEHTLERSLPYNDRVKQWGPLIFAHNVHGKFKWFQTKWDRFKDSFKEGEHWITGHSNHDNARYFYRLVKLNPGKNFTEGHLVDNFYNDQFGSTLPDIAHNALDNGALSALNLAFLPGSPMFFINTLFHTPWLFFRDIDYKYDIKVVADEGSRFLTWYIDETLYNTSEHFQRIKKLGFKELKQLVSPPEYENPIGFMDILFELHEKIKTDPVMVMYLFDDPAEEGHYENVNDLQQRINLLSSPENKKDKALVEELKNRMAQDPIESRRKIKFARNMLKKSMIQVEKELQEELINQKTSLQLQQEKLLFLKEQNDHTLSLLLEDAAAHEEYNIYKWAENRFLVQSAPAEMKENNKLTVEKLKLFAHSFMLDARDVCKLHHYEKLVNQEQALFNFNLRQFRQENNWLKYNPANDITRDYFNRKIITNGAKDLGAFFSDKGDIINANTIYFGWRTSPDERKQIFIIANMEGKPLHQLPLSQFLEMEGPWQVVLKSPSLKNIPARLTKEYVIENFKNGEVVILERKLNKED